MKKYNEKQLNLLEGELEVLQAKNILTTRKYFEPYVDEDDDDGKVKGTPLINNLYRNKEAKVILIHNVDVGDGLNNGAKGESLRLCKKRRDHFTHHHTV